MWFKRAGSKGSSAEACSNASADLLSAVGKGTLRKRDSDIFALHFISSSDPKEMLQQIFFLCGLEHFDPYSRLPPYFYPHLWVLSSTCSHGAG